MNKKNDLFSSGSSAFLLSDVTKIAVGFRLLQRTFMQIDLDGKYFDSLCIMLSYKLPLSPVFIIFE